MANYGEGRGRRWGFAVVAGGLTFLLMMDPFGAATLPTYADQLQARSDAFGSAVTALGVPTAAASVPMAGSWEDPPSSGAIAALSSDLPSEDEEVVVLVEQQEDDGEPELLLTEEEPPASPIAVDVELGGLDVSVAQVASEATPAAVLLRVAGADELEDAGITGVLLDVVDASETPVEDSLVQLTVDYSTFAGLRSGDWASRLRFVWIPDCDGLGVDCAPQPIETVNDVATQTVTAVVPVAPEQPLVSALPAPSSSSAPASLMSASGGAGSLAITAGASGAAGDWAATSLSASSSWGNSGSTGAFTWSLPILTPSAPAGPAPQLGFSYTSATSDGRTPSSNNQSGVIGEGFDITEAYVERGYEPCSEDEAGSANNVDRASGDLCWGAENATMMFNGSSVELIHDATTGEWHPERNDGTKVERLTGAWNAGEANEYWKVTTSNGIQYFFGRDRVSSGGSALNSAWTVPVYGNHPGERCNALSFADSSCVQVWRWNLDYVVDPSGNSMTYFYDIESNRYVYDVTANPDRDTAVYVAGGHLNRIEYGTRAGSEGAGSAPLKVTFSYGPRCITDLADSDSWCSSAQGSTDANHWLDTPTDLICSTSALDYCENYSPAFFDRVRLAEVSTAAFDGTAYRPLNTWALSQTFDGEGSGIGLEYSTNVMLVLRGVTHTGKGGTSSSSDDITSPPFKFTYDFFANRIASDLLAVPLLRPRIIAIRTDSGAQITVNYTTGCAPGDVPDVSDPAQAANNRLCFPVKWSRGDGTDPVIEYFHKYVVASIVESGASPAEPGGNELITGSLDTVTTFAYTGGAAWAKPTGPLVKEDEVTYSDFRGMATVTTTIGVGAEASSARVTYYRGMGGQLTAGPAGHQITTTDHEELQGQPFDSVTLNGIIPTSEVVAVPAAPVVVATSAAGFEATRIPSSSSFGFTFDASGVLQHRTRTIQTFDANSQTVSIDDRGDATTNTDDVCTTVTYAHESNGVLEGKNIIARPGETRVVAGTCGASPNLPDDMISAERNTYDNSGRLTRTEKLDPTDGIGYLVSSEILSYDVRGRALQVADAAGRVTTTQHYDTAAGLTSSTKTTSPDPDGLGPLSGFQNTVSLNPLTGLINSTTDPNGLVTSRTYDSLGRLLTVVLPEHQGRPLPSIAYEYVVHPGGLNAVLTKTLASDGNSQLTSAVFYDGLLRAFQTQTSALDAGDDHNDTAEERGREVTHTYYNSAGRVVRVAGQWWAQGAVALTPVVPVAVPPSWTTYTYDAAGRATTEVFWVGTDSEPTNEKWRTVTVYDGDTTLVIPPLGAVPEATVVDARGLVVERIQYVRDPDDHAAADTPGEVLALASQTTRYVYDISKQLTEVRDSENNVWSYDYDWGGRLVGAVDPDSGSSTTTYDVLDRVSTRTNANEETLAYTYDALGRADTVRDGSVSGAIRTRLTYDTALGASGAPMLGQVATSTRYVDGHAYVTEIDRYDKAYRPVETTFTLPDIPAYQSLDTLSFTNEYTFTVGGQAASVSLPAIVADSGTKALGAETITTRYDSASMPSWMSGGFGWGTYVAESRYGSDGRVTGVDIGNTYGAYVTYGYEHGTNRLTGISLERQNLGVGLRLAYGYDAAGNVTSLTDRPTTAASSQDNQCFGYDGLRRLQVAWTALLGDCSVLQGDIEVADVGGAQPYWTEYGYDASGNRTSMTEHGIGGSQTKTSTYAVGTGTMSPHQLAGVTETSGGTTTTTTFDYDDVGNRVERTSGQDSTAYSWDVEGKLVADDDYDYIYDASGNRIVRDGPDGTTVYLPGGQEVTIDGATVSANRYYSFNGRTVATRTSNGLGGVTSLVSDRDGTVVAAVPNTQWTSTSLARMYSDPFGGIRGGSDSAVPGDRRFLGGTLDDASGLTLLGARYYDAEIGRFLSVDPVVDLNVPAHLNAYSYAYNNPMTYSDPTGLAPGGKGKGFGTKTKSGTSAPDPGPGPDAPPDTSWAALANCTDIWCSAQWMGLFTLNYYGGIVEVLGSTLLMSCAVCQVWNSVAELVTIFSDWDAYWAQKEAERIQFWSDPLGNIWKPIAEDWVNNPGHAFGGTVATAGTFAIPGGGALKVGSALKAGTALKSGSVLEVSTATKLAPDSIRFSQTSVNDVATIEASMRADGWVGAPIDVVQMGDGVLTTVDNSRLLAAKLTGTEVQAVVHSMDDAIPAGVASRFPSSAGELPTTWGDAVFNRIAKQNVPYRTTYPNGSPFTGWTGN